MTTSEGTGTAFGQLGLHRQRVLSGRTSTTIVHRLSTVEGAAVMDGAVAMDGERVVKMALVSPRTRVGSALAA